MTISEEKGRWYIQAERWISILNYATRFSTGLLERLQNGKVLAPCEIRDGWIFCSEELKNRRLFVLEGAPPSLHCLPMNELPQVKREYPDIKKLGINYPESLPGLLKITDSPNSLEGQFQVYEPYNDYSDAQLKSLFFLEQMVSKIKKSAKMVENLKLPEIVDNQSEQEVAGFIEKFLANKSIAFMMVQGPPGTGKTALLAKTVKYLVDKNPSCSILCIAQTRRAVDEISNKLEKEGVKHLNQLRGEGPANGKPYCSTIMRASVLNNSFDVVMVDESSQVTIGLGLTAATKVKENGILRFFGDEKQLDPVIPIIEENERINKEILEGPIIITEEQDGRNGLPLYNSKEGIYITLSNKNFEPQTPISNEEEMYDKNKTGQLIKIMLGAPDNPNPWSHSWLGLCNIESLEFSKELQNLKTMLCHGYRMSPAIQEYPSSKWYRNSLKTHLKDEELPGELSGIEFLGQEKSWNETIKNAIMNNNIIFIMHEELQDRENDGLKRHFLEKELVLFILKLWDFKRIANPDYYGVVTPFKAQDANIRFAYNLQPKQCATVERFQGRDVERMVISLVTTEPDIYKREGRVFSPNKYNVAITRAKKQLVIIGHKRMFDGTILKNLEDYINGLKEEGNETYRFLEKYPLKYLEAIHSHYKWAESSKDNKVGIIHIKS